MKQKPEYMQLENETLKNDFDKINARLFSSLIVHLGVGVP